MVFIAPSLQTLSGSVSGSFPLALRSESQAVGPGSQPGAVGALAPSLLGDTTVTSVLGVGTLRDSGIMIELSREVGR